MTYRIITVQFAVPDDDPAFTLIGLRDDIQEAFYDERGASGSFKIIGAKDCRGGESDASMFDAEAFDAATVIPNAPQIIRAEAHASGVIRYSVDGVMPDDTLGPDEEARAPYQVFDIDAQVYVPGEFSNRAEAQTQADRMNAAIRKDRLKEVATARRYDLTTEKVYFKPQTS